MSKSTTKYAAIEFTLASLFHNHAKGWQTDYFNIPIPLQQSKTSTKWEFSSLPRATVTRRVPVTESSPIGFAELSAVWREGICPRILAHFFFCHRLKDCCWRCCDLEANHWRIAPLSNSNGNLERDWVRKKMYKNEKKCLFHDGWKIYISFPSHRSRSVRAFGWRGISLHCSSFGGMSSVSSTGVDGIWTLLKDCTHTKIVKKATTN